MNVYGTLLRYILTIGLLGTVARHSHWSVAVALIFSYVGSELETYMRQRSDDAMMRVIATLAEHYKEDITRDIG